MSGTQRCTGMENKLVEYLDGRAKPAERRAVEDIWPPAPNAARAPKNFACSGTRWTISRCSLRPPHSMRRFARGLPPNRAPRFLGLAAVAKARFCRDRVGCHVGLVVFDAAGRTTTQETPSRRYTADADFGMIRDLPVLENYDVLSKFDALSELPVAPAAAKEK